MFNARKEVEKNFLLLENTLKCLLKYGQVTISDIRERTIYQFDSREISWALKKLRKIGIVSYDHRVWYLNQTMIKGLGLIAFQELLSYVLKKGA